MMKNKRILIVYNFLQHYRIPFFEHLGSKSNLTVICDKGDYKPVNFHCRTVGTFTLYGFKIRIGLFSINAREFDEVIFLPEPNYPLDLLYFFWLKTKGIPVSTWGIWPTTSVVMNWVRKRMTNAAFRNYFYCSEHMEYYRLLGVPSEKLSIAANSVADEEIAAFNQPNEQLNVLFVGTLNKRKGLEELVRFWIERIPQNIHLRIVGDGIVKQTLKSLIDTSISKNIQLCDGTTRSDSLNEHFGWSHVSINYKQAGLSVLSSLQRGVPVLCLTSAVSGGEKFAIAQGLTGYFYQNLHEAENILCQLIDKPETITELSKNAMLYAKYRNISVMSKPFLK